MSVAASQDIFIASEEERLEEENECRVRKKLPLVQSVSPDWHMLLTEKQQGYLPVYRQLWVQSRRTIPEDDPCCIFDLSQDPSKRPAMTGAAGCLPCLRHSGNILWSPRLRRWLVAAELAAASGFPVHPRFAEVAGTEVDVLSRYEAKFKDLGNGMVTWNVAVVLASALSCAVRVEGNKKRISIQFVRIKESWPRSAFRPSLFFKSDSSKVLEFLFIIRCMAGKCRCAKGSVAFVMRNEVSSPAALPGGWHLLHRPSETLGVYPNP